MSFAIVAFSYHPHFSSPITGPITVDSIQDGYELSLTRRSSSSGEVAVNGKVVTTPDLPASNGVVHGLSNVLLPDCVTQNLVDLLAGMPEFSTLVELVVVAGLANELSVTTSEGLTVLAPNNDAFQAVPQYIIDFLASNADALVQVLTYHVVPSNVLSAALVSGPVTTLQGEAVNVLVNGSTIRFNDAVVLAADKLASNGIIHEIDAVLVPPSLVLPSAPTASALPALPEPASAPVSSGVGTTRSSSSRSSKSSRSSMLTSYAGVEQSLDASSSRGAMLASSAFVVCLVSIGLFL